MKQDRRINSGLTGAAALAAALITGGLPVAATAQTNTAAAQQTFFNSAAQYFSAFDTNLTTFTGDRLDIWAGADTVNNQNLTASFGVEYQLGKNLSAESITRNATVAGVVVSEQGGFGYNLTYIDTRLTGYLDTGYRFDTRQVYLAPGLRVKKALTENTYAGIGLELPVYFTHGAGQSAGAPSPTLSIFTGFKF